MPVKSKGTLLAVSALLGMLAVGTGCQSIKRHLAGHSGQRPGFDHQPQIIAKAQPTAQHPEESLQPMPVVSTTQTPAAPLEPAAITQPTPGTALPGPGTVIASTHQNPIRPVTAIEEEPFDDSSATTIALTEADNEPVYIPAPIVIFDSEDEASLEPVQALTREQLVMITDPPMRSTEPTTRPADQPIARTRQKVAAKSTKPRAGTSPPADEPLPMPKKTTPSTPKASPARATPRKVPQYLPQHLPSHAPHHVPHAGHPHVIPREFAKRALSQYVVEPPDILVVQASPNIGRRGFPIPQQQLVRPDGTIGLGIYGSVFVAGKTIAEVRFAIARQLSAWGRQVLATEDEEEARRAYKDLLQDPKDFSEEAFQRERKIREKRLTLSPAQIAMELQVEVLAYNSKYYYIITDGGGYGEQVYRLPITGNETVLDALSQIQGLPAVASKKRIWVARATPGHAHPMILGVDWCGIVQRGAAETNYQIFPGDRIYVNSQRMIRVDSFLAKFLSPIERILGTTLLGASTVNSISGRGAGGGGGGF